MQPALSGAKNGKGKAGSDGFRSASGERPKSSEACALVCSKYLQKFSSEEVREGQDAGQARRMFHQFTTIKQVGAVRYSNGGRS
jgi:hypothetical protein